MRLVVWNCNAGSLARKLDALRALEPDVAVVPECPSSINDTALPLFGDTRAVWIGRGRRGLAVLGFGAWSPALDSGYDDRLEWIAPVHIDGPTPFFLLGVWAFNHRAAVTHPDRPERWQVQQSLDVYAPQLAVGPTVVAGDFNHNVNWDQPRGKKQPGNHAIAVERLESLGLVSAYHGHRSVAHGAEPDPTLYWRDRRADGPTYHIDYCFVPASWHVTNVEVGTHAEWVGSRLSDHVPVVVDVDP